MSVFSVFYIIVIKCHHDEEFTGMMGNLAKALDERHKVMHSSDEDDDDDEDEDWDDDEDEDWSD